MKTHLRGGLAALLLFFALFAFSQDIEWNYSFGGSGDEVVTSVYATSDGGSIVVGYSNSNDGNVTGNHGENDYWVVKLNNLGIMQWQKSLGGTSQHDYAYSVIENARDGFVIAGSSFSKNGDIKDKQNKGGDDCWIIALNSAGKTNWSYNFGGAKRDAARSIIETRDGSYVMAGSTESNDMDVSGNHGQNDFWILKIKNNGKKIWQKCIGGTANDNAYAVIETSDGGLLVAGETNSTNGDVKGNKGSYDGLVVKLSAVGELEWQKCFGGSNDDVLRSAIESADGGFILAGETQSGDGDIKQNYGAVDCWVIKVSSSGTLVWSKTYGGSSFDFASQISNGAYGGYLMAGATNSTDNNVKGSKIGSDNAWLVKLNTAGDIFWQKVYGGNNIDQAIAVAATKESDYIVAGISYSNDGDISSQQAKGSSDYWLMKITDNNIGSYSNVFSQENTNRKKEASTAVAVSADGGYIAAGWVEEKGQKDIVMVKYDINGTEIWRKKMGGSGDDVPNCMMVAADSAGYFILGETNSGDKDFRQNKGDYDVFLMKINLNGDLEWTKTYGGSRADKGRWMTATSDKNYIFTAQSQSNTDDVADNKGNFDYWVVKIAPDGKILWEKSFGGSDVDIPNKIIETAEGKFLVAGSTNSSSGDIKQNNGIGEAWLIQLDSSGKLVWQKNYGGNSRDIANDIIAVGDNGYIIAGGSESSNGDVDKNAGGSDFWLIKILTTGELEWQKTYGGQNNEEAKKIIITADGGYIVAGNSNSRDGDVLLNSGLQDTWLIKLDSKGKLQWQVNFGEQYNDGCNSLVQFGENLYLIAGYQGISKTDTQFWVTEYVETNK